MKFLSNKKTLDYQLYGRPLSSAINFQSGSYAQMGKQTAKLHAQGKWGVVESAARFYLYNHAVAMITKKYHRHEELPPDALDVLERFNEYGNQLVARMIGYVATICVRESRHCHSQTDVANVVNQKFGKPAKDFIFSVPDSAEASMQYAMNMVPEGLTIGNAMGALSHCFWKGKWSSAFGGPKWAVIADTLWKASKAEITLEVFLDIAFTLAHNGGPIFNKGVVFDHPNATHLLMVLDAQRAGFMPALFNEGGCGAVNTNVIEEMKGLKQWIYDNFPNTENTVDWVKVKALGGVGNFVHLNKGKNTQTASSQKAAPAPHKLDEDVLQTIEMFPKVFVNTISRETLKKFKKAA